MSRHQRLQMTMRSPARKARHAAKRPSTERQRAYADNRVPLAQLFEAVPQWRPRKKEMQP